MKKLSLVLLLLFAVCQLSMSQSKNELVVYLLLNSDKNEMSVLEKEINDSVNVKTFSLSKNFTTENFKYALSVGENGKIMKDSKYLPKFKEAKVTLYYFSYMQNEKILNDLPSENVIEYEDFINSEFKSFNKVLNRASQIFVVDLKNHIDTSSNYLAYEVKL